jgi:serine/threonine protein kinase
MQTLQPNATLQGGKYIIKKVLGQGGFGITYLAEHELLGTNVAIKEFFIKQYCDRDETTSHVVIGTVSNLDEVKRYEEKFIKEARVIARLNHPNIIKIHDVFRENNTAYYVMDYIGGENLNDIVKRVGPLPESEAKEFILQIANALAYIHKNNLNHLDIKPANIMIREIDSTAVLIDFGMSKQYDISGGQTSTTPVGISHGYAPLEQYKEGGVREFSPQTDIYALGATYYKLLTGKTPPDAQDLLEEDLPEFECNPFVKNAIVKAMQPKRSARPKTIEEWVELINTDDKNSAGHKEPPSKSVTKQEETVLIGAPIPSSIQVSVERTNGFSNGYEWIDLGLPSGRKWATCNIGANHPHDYGNMFAWGEIEKKSIYEWTNYVDAVDGNCNTFNVFFNGGGLNKIDQSSEADAAHIIWQGSWHLPSCDDFEELRKFCNWQWTTRNNVNGYLVTSKVNSNSIFLPAAGWHRHVSLGFRTTYGHYWTSDLSTKDNTSQTAPILYFHSKLVEISGLYRYIGCSIRPVI